MEDQSRKYFCYFEINDTAELIVESVLTALSLLLVGDAFRKYFKMRGTHNRHVTLVYMMLIGWWITYVVSNACNVLIYILYKSEVLSTINMSKFTKIYFVLDWLTAFMIQWLLIYLPFQWSKQISELFDPKSRIRRSQVNFVGSEGYNGYETRIYQTLRVYKRFRLLYLALAVLFLILQDESILYKIMVACLLVDCTFIAFSLIFGMISLKTTEQLKQMLDEDESKRTFNQYTVVLVANTIRFGFDLYYVIQQLFFNAYFYTDCPSPDESNIVLDITFNSVTTILTFYIPIFIILRIYNLEDNPELMCQSLIISNQNKESFNSSQVQN